MIYPKSKKAQAITQIVILLISIIAISWMIGSEVKEVSAADPPSTTAPCTLTHCVGDMVYGSKRNADGFCVEDNSPSGYIKYCKTGCNAGTCNLELNNPSTTTPNTPKTNTPSSTSSSSSSTSSSSGTNNCKTACFQNYQYPTKPSGSSCTINFEGYKIFCPYGCDSTIGLCQTKEQQASGKGFLQGALNTVGTITAPFAAYDQIKGVGKRVSGWLGKGGSGTGGAGSGGAGAGGSGGNGFFASMGDFLFGTKASAADVTKYGGKLVEGETWMGVGGETIGGAIGAVVVWSAFAFIMGRYVIGPALGLSVHNSQALGTALAAGMLTFTVTTSTPIMASILSTSAVGGPVGIVIGLAVTAITMLFTWRNSSADVIQLPCYQWEAQNGKEVGTTAAKKARCEMCNKEAGELPCTEYQCRSLGAGCELVNEEDSGRQLCIWVNPNDITPPVITPLDAALLEDFKYTPDKAVSPPNRGVKIAYNGKEQVTTINGTRCAPAYTRVSFGISLDEAAKCKLSTVDQESYEKMGDLYMGRGIYDMNQSFILSLPSKEALAAQNITVENKKNYSLFVRCQDKNGNANVANFVFNFCINEGPDRTAPQIVGTWPIAESGPIAFNQATFPIKLFTNEPAECRWSFMDKEYNLMENNMTCRNLATDMNTQFLYDCNANLTGLKNGQNNYYYFRCKDQPRANESLRNTNKASYKLNLIGTRPLVIKSAKPNNTVIEDSTNAVKVQLSVETFAGEKDGNAICAFSETGDSRSFVDFFYESGTEDYSQHLHTQDLWLTNGSYNYFIRCRDKGGNIDTKEINFTVATDTTAPTVVRVFNEDNYLKIITDEPADCAFSQTSCVFDLNEEGNWDANAMSTEGDKNYADWNVNYNYYIKCKDEYGKRPAPDKCSITVRPFDLLEAQ